ncbi:MAG: hypothetical protein IT288_08085 [Bdellovibrionales bacterium]|nr:hypothetical protein [Bdellovibrionales bacterium]
MNSDQPGVKKVPPYPIEIQVPWEGKIALMKILKLTERGAIVDTLGAILPVGVVIENTRFVLPTTDIAIMGPMKVMKNHDRVLGDRITNQTIQRLSELQFVKLSENDRNEVRRFLVRIKQVVRP